MTKIFQTNQKEKNSLAAKQREPVSYQQVQIEEDKEAVSFKCWRKSISSLELCIQQNYDKEISNSQISEKLGYHSFYLNRVFKKHTRMTIHQAVISEKMRIAKKILEETELSVNAIAIEVGYSEHSRFCTAFKKYVGVTPLEYRKKKMWSFRFSRFL